MVSATGGLFSIVSWADHDPRYAWTDYVHLTSRGYRRLADLFTSALLQGYAPESE
jgi:lysophospholipase L1-like esterase